MPIRSLIEGGSYPPEALEFIYEAFDMAWSEVAEIYGTDPTRIAFARASLARAIISAAQADVQNTEQLKSKALEVLRTMGLDRG